MFLMGILIFVMAVAGLVIKQNIDKKKQQILEKINSL